MIKTERAGREHIAAIADIARRSFPDPWSEKSFESELSYGGLFEAAIDDDGAVLGFVIVRPSEYECELLDIAVSPEKRRMGIGKLLLNRAVEYTAGVGAERLWLEVRAGNASAAALYEKHGFYAVGRRKNYYENPTEDAILMDKEINR